ncbi:hypothetical protein LSTR_LSTR014587 [Laodelphax striatellus]|uniref:Uncharacterized protein n=1 Tax=Laodelphax striatellus TaxID=195883 RepID=A0A482XEF9_LAOST|nr:hypothetical protein LSTR_LSTR014587 [Laodelphax striatellus]
MEDAVTSETTAQHALLFPLKASCACFLRAEKDEGELHRGEDGVDGEAVQRRMRDAPMGGKRGRGGVGGVGVGGGGGGQRRRRSSLTDLEDLQKKRAGQQSGHLIQDEKKVEEEEKKNEEAEEKGGEVKEKEGEEDKEEEEEEEEEEDEVKQESRKMVSTFL